MGESSLGTPPSERASEDRLDSWKEIAVYLNRDVTTVQRWEKREGMPVHRHQHDRMGSVYASRAELDAWTRSRNLRAAQDNEISSSSTEPSGPPRSAVSTSPARRKFAWLMAGVAVIALLFAALEWMRGRDGIRSKQAAVKSIAVLPLKNLSGDPSQEYLADGMTEELMGGSLESAVCVSSLALR